MDAPVQCLKCKEDAEQSEMKVIFVGKRKVELFFTCQKCRACNYVSGGIPWVYDYTEGD